MNETEQKIYNTAKILFYKNGYYKTTVRQITDSAEVNSGLFNYYYKNKYNLAVKLIDDIFYKIQNLTGEYYSLNKNPAVFQGIMMRMHGYCFNDKRIITFIVDAFKEGIFEESVLETTKILIGNINQYYKTNLSDEERHLALALTLGIEKSVFIQNYQGKINYDVKTRADIVLNNHLFHLQLEKKDREDCLEKVITEFQRILDKDPDFVRHLI